jgi:hypothetical protein
VTGAETREMDDDAITHDPLLMCVTNPTYPHLFATHARLYEFINWRVAGRKLMKGMDVMP